MPEDIISQVMNSTFLGVPTIFIIGLLIFFIIIIWRMKPKESKAPHIDLKKEVKKDLDSYNLTTLNKPLKAGFQVVGYGLGFHTLFWNKAEPLNKNLKLKQEKQAYDKEAKPEDIIQMTLIKYVKNNIISKALGKIGLIGKYIIMPTEEIKNETNEINLNPLTQPTYFLDIAIYGKHARKFIENIAFKLTRELELGEMVSFVPKMNYLETNIAGAVAKAREKAQIEKEKYKGQIESAEEV